MSSFEFIAHKESAAAQNIPLLGPPSSPSPLPPAYGQNGRKERRNPSITPRKFRQFFTPRSEASADQSSARQALNDITEPSNNRRVAVMSSPIRFKSISEKEAPSSFPQDLKRRKLLHTPEATPDHTFARSKSRGGFKVLRDDDDEDEEQSEDDLRNLQSSPCERAVHLDQIGEEEAYQEPLRRILTIDRGGLGGRLLQSMSGLPTRSRRQRHAYPVNDWQDETASFYSRPSDVHVCTGLMSPRCVIPFCAVGCNTNSLVAVGDEQGRVRLLDSAEDQQSKFSTVHLGWRVHTNAIIDMVFSPDDKLLATASGDQSARVVDMTTQTTVAILDNHSASVKQVLFQPGRNSGSVLATSGRDGMVQIWDLRCNAISGPKQRWTTVEPTSHATHSGKLPTYRRAVYSIFDAHRQVDRNALNPLIPGNDTTGRREIIERNGDVSVTALSFLPEGNEHLLLTASEVDASVMLWDLRSLHSKHRKPQVAVSKTRQPESHSQWRHFAINSMNLNSDGSRLYTLCKDNTVYAYSTSHLILGHAPELSLSNSGRRLPPQETKEGLGPMYGFRHPKLHATSFYVKSVLRPARNGQSEMLAVGSSVGCAVLFPTDERYFPKYEDRVEKDSSSVPIFLRRPVLRRTGSAVVNSSRIEERIPISMNGTPLIRGHDREIGALTWTAEGKLVTVGDDCLIRCWREGEDARDLRVGGEAEGRRWGCGWADVSETYDEDDD